MEPSWIWTQSNAFKNMKNFKLIKDRPLRLEKFYVMSKEQGMPQKNNKHIKKAKKMLLKIGKRTYCFNLMKIMNSQNLELIQIKFRKIKITM